MKPLRTPSDGSTSATNGTENVNGSENPGASGDPGERENGGAGEGAVADAADWSPALSRSVMLRHDRVRGTDLLLMPERVVVLRGSAGDVLRLCDGRREVGAIVAELAERYPGASVAAEVPEFLGRLREEGWIR
ncbi:pyrroloquinoline quinone biosynthesis peptide chaperone PqqD [Streptomyces sp. NPDC057199]|uniref:pyrroloquinoline quinone biosynthesis peptide chaperone PqqD n=1 Tax=Streptomyces sp. NPDC057199 TaxID=3346047 RepID=UPI003624E3A8